MQGLDVTVRVNETSRIQRATIFWSISGQMMMVTIDNREGGTFSLVLDEYGYLQLRALTSNPFPGGAEELDMAHANGEVLCDTCQDKGWWIPEDGQIGEGKRTPCNNKNCTAEWNGL